MMFVAPSPRSYLYVPADQPKLVDKSARVGADAVILDLEDSVVVSRKPVALDALVRYLQEPRGEHEVWVRVNQGPGALDEIRCLLPNPYLTGIWLPKAEMTEPLEAAVALIVGTSPATQVGLLVESARGLFDLPRMLTLQGIARTQLGEVDLRADLRMHPVAGGLLDWHRAWLLTHSVAHHAVAIAPVDPLLAHETSFEASCMALAASGFSGRACIHPAQVEIANRCFGYTDEELARAARLLDDYELHLQAGVGAYRDNEGNMVDAATVQYARRMTQRLEPQ